MTSEDPKRGRLSADIEQIRDANSGGDCDVESESDSEVDADEKIDVGGEGEPGVHSELKSDIDSGEKSVIVTREESMVDTGRKCAVENETESNTEVGTGVNAKLESDSRSGPVRFQLRARKRTVNPKVQGALEALTGYPDEGPVRLKKPRRVDFPTISENDFLEVVDAIEKACEDKKWKDAFEMVDFLCARKCDERVMEMKAQLQMEVGENFEAVKNCERAIKLNPRWWEGHRTHGRCLLSIGESALATKAFERAIYINPADEDLRSELRSALKSERRQ